MDERVGMGTASVVIRFSVPARSTVRDQDGEKDALRLCQIIVCAQYSAEGGALRCFVCTAGALRAFLRLNVCLEKVLYRAGSPLSNCYMALRARYGAGRYWGIGGTGVGRGMCGP